MLERNIKELCKRRGITLSQLGEECGFGTKSIYTWVKGTESMERMKRVADYFGVTVDDLLKPDSGQGNA